MSIEIFLECAHIFPLYAELEKLPETRVGAILDGEQHQWIVDANFAGDDRVRAATGSSPA